ncbi:MAG: sodium:calcium antiporter [Candidatus Eremiobacteraeota bacterium]|nr:sodium:calcium antiporter [Candidatus Eremiobacteraeota bacterium]MBC5826510.1 sodium:calcium antiporter [Candidatus Eremiobacteraeota bacterium]
MPIAVAVFAALVLLVIASDAFTNAVEWIGARFNLTRSAIGAVVAAIGSSLPDIIVTVIALVFLHDAASQSIGIGAVIGAPLMLATLIFCLVGLVALVMRAKRPTLQMSAGASLFGLALFTLTFALVIAASFTRSHGLRIALCAIVALAYGAYLAYHFRRGLAESEDQPPRLRLAPHKAEPPLWAVFVQLAFALAVTVAASRWFITSVTGASQAVGLPPFVISVILTPIAAEMPEAMNVLIWMRRGLDELAFGNVLGAMMFQTSIASAIAMLYTPWQLDRSAYAAAVLTLGAAVLVLISTAVRRRLDARPLAMCGFFYVAYIVYLIATRA